MSNAQHFHVTGVCLHCGSPKFLGIFDDRIKTLEYMDTIPSGLREMEEIKEEVIARKITPDILEVTMGEHRTVVFPVGCFDEIKVCQDQHTMYMMSLSISKIMDELMGSGNPLGAEVGETTEPFVDKSADILKGFNFPTDFGSGPSPEVN